MPWRWILWGYRENNHHYNVKRVECVLNWFSLKIDHIATASLRFFGTTKEKTTTIRKTNTNA